MSVSVEAPAWSLDLVGRPALIEGGRVLTMVSAARGLGVFTDYEPGRELTGAELVALPVTGECVEVQDGSESVSGQWLGLVSEGPSVGHVDAFVLCGGSVRQVRAEAPEADARQSVTGPADEGQRVALSALLAEARSHYQTRARQEARMETLVEDAHRFADDSDLCERFDDFMGEHGLPRRSRDFEVRVEVTATLHLTRPGASLDDVIDELSTDEVFDALTRDVIQFNAEDY